ncbi:MAG TPA: helix-turn-helix transcriptional regulator [Vicinamibacterales bacterium]|nr:helix-turn-helix transcriptional regulator [Vicinamibacterales bacterium]
MPGVLFRSVPFRSTRIRLTSRRAANLIVSRAGEHDLRLADIATELRVEERWLSRHLKKNTLKGFFEHLHDARCDRARQLLIATTGAVKAIAWQVGYRRASDLDREYRRRFGKKPSSDRARESLDCE